MSDCWITITINVHLPPRVIKICPKLWRSVQNSSYWMSFWYHYQDFKCTHILVGKFVCRTYSAKMYSKMPNLINKWSSSVVVIYNLSSEVGCDYRVSLFASHVTSYSWLVSLKGSNINNIHTKPDWSWNQQPNLANLVLTSPCRCPVVVVDL